MTNDSEGASRTGRQVRIRADFTVWGDNVQDCHQKAEKAALDVMGVYAFDLTIDMRAVTSGDGEIRMWEARCEAVTQ